MLRIAVLVVVLFSGGLTLAADRPFDAARVQSLIKTIAEVGPQGAGSEPARQAVRELKGYGLEMLPRLLAAMDTENVVAANWYRDVYEDLILREQSQPAAAWSLPHLRTYVEDEKRSGRARRLVLSLLEKFEPTFGEQWIPTRLGDPEFGDEAVEAALAAGATAAKQKNLDLAKAAYRQAFEHARDSKHVSTAAQRLKGLGETVDVYWHLGLVVDWRKVATFDAPDRSGFAAVFEPETKLEALAARQNPFSDATWIEAKHVNALGQIDLNDAFGLAQEKVGYVVAEIDVPSAREAQVRCGADDNCTIWLNGVRVFGREQWLNGTRFDRFTAPVSLVAGRNILLVKVCQGPHHRDPEVPNNWSLQLRLCDEQGRGIEFTPVADPAKVQP